MSLAPTRNHPDVFEGYIGAYPYEVYALQKWHGQMQFRISMPRQRFIGMSKEARDRWLADARRRVSRGART